MTEVERKEFREICRVLFDPQRTPGVVVTPEIAANPLYKRYQQLAPSFYSMMIASRRKVGLRT